MSVTNPWLTPYQRSFQQIKSKLLDELKNLKSPTGENLITDYSEGNILVMIISMFSSIAEVIHYYIDSMYREAFFSTARKFDSLVKHGELVDYHPHGAVASTVDVVLSRPINSTSMSSDIVIPKDTQFTDSSGNIWLVTKDLTWPAKSLSITIPCVQHYFYDDISIVGTRIGNLKLSPNNKPLVQIPNTFNTNNYYDEGTMTLTINNEPWLLVDTFAFSGKYDKHFRVEVNSNHDVFIVFGDDKNGMIPDPGSIITGCTYYITSGLNGNVPAGSIVNIPSVIRLAAYDAICSNPYPASGGSNYEDYYMLRERIPLHVRTLGVAITKQDFMDLAKTVDGVNKVAIEYECGRKLNIYITPYDGIVASQVLMERVYEVLKQHSPLTTWLNIKPVGEVSIILDIDIMGRKGHSTTEIQDQVINALMDKYSIYNTEIGGSVRISDIYALIDNLPSVDYLHINKFYLKPWPTTIYGTTPLIIDNFTIDKAEGNMKYLLVFDTDTDYTIYSMSNGFSVRGKVGSSLTVDDTLNNFKYGINIINNGYSPGNRYTFVVSAPNFDYTDPGYNLPTFTDPSQATLNINEVL